MNVETFYGTMLATVLMVVTFFVLVLAFLYLIYAREEASPAKKA